MVFRSSPTERVTPSIAVALAGILATTLAAMVPGAPRVLYVLAGLLYLLAGVLATWRTRIHVLERHEKVTKIHEILVWGWSQDYPFSSFRSVGVGYSKRFRSEGEVVYRLLLKGAPNLTFPSSELSERYVRAKGAKLAMTMGVPFDPRPRPVLASPIG